MPYMRFAAFDGRNVVRQKSRHPQTQADRSSCMIREAATTEGGSSTGAAEIWHCFV